MLFVNATTGEPPQIERIRQYWNDHIHDLEITRHAPGSPDFFEELDAYRFEKLEYLPRLVDFQAYAGKMLLEVGCGVGIDLARFAKSGAIVTGIDLAEVSIDLARKNFAAKDLSGSFQVMNGEALRFSDDSFDAVYAHGVLQYTADDRQMVAEIHRVLRKGGQAVLMVYNRHSWLPAISRLTGVSLEHDDAPVFRTYSRREFESMLEPFTEVRIVPERFPVKTRLHQGYKALLFNRLFVGSFNLLPRRLVQPLGWHLVAFVKK